MGLLPPPPDWGLEILGDIPTWNRFVAGIRAVLPSIDPAAMLDAQEGYAELTVDGRAVTIGLANVARKCAASGDFTETIRAWSELIVASLRDAGARIAMPWELASRALRVQLYNDERRGGMNVVARALAPDLHLALVIDSDISLMTVTPEMAAAWGKDEDDLFERAIANTYAAVSVTTSPARRAPSLKIVAGVDDYTAAATYLALAEHVKDEALGVLAVFGTRFTCAVLPLQHRLPPSAMQTMLAGRAMLRPSDDGAITANVYWWRRDQLEMVPVLDVAGTNVLLWPDDLKGLLR